MKFIQKASSQGQNDHFYTLWIRLLSVSFWQEIVKEMMKISAIEVDSSFVTLFQDENLNKLMAQDTFGYEHQSYLTKGCRNNLKQRTSGLHLSLK